MGTRQSLLEFHLNLFTNKRNCLTVLFILGEYDTISLINGLFKEIRRRFPKKFQAPKVKLFEVKSSVLNRLLNFYYHQVIRMSCPYKEKEIAIFG